MLALWRGERAPLRSPSWKQLRPLHGYSERNYKGLFQFCFHWHEYFVGKEVEELSTLRTTQLEDCAAKERRGLTVKCRLTAAARMYILYNYIYIYIYCVWKYTLYVYYTIVSSCAAFCLLFWAVLGPSLGLFTIPARPGPESTPSRSTGARQHGSPVDRSSPAPKICRAFCIPKCYMFLWMSRTRIALTIWL